MNSRSSVGPAGNRWRHISIENVLNMVFRPVVNSRSVLIKNHCLNFAELFVGLTRNLLLKFVALWIGSFQKLVGISSKASVLRKAVLGNLLGSFFNFFLFRAQII